MSILVSGLSCILNCCRRPRLKTQEEGDRHPVVTERTDGLRHRVVVRETREEETTSLVSRAVATNPATTPRTYRDLLVRRITSSGLQAIEAEGTFRVRAVEERVNDIQTRLDRGGAVTVEERRYVERIINAPPHLTGLHIRRELRGEICEEISLEPLVPMLGPLASMISCYEYALYVQREFQVLRELSRSGDVNQIVPILERKRYTFHSTPQVGDFVLFFKDKVLIHMGIWRDNDRVESKWGSQIDIAYRHRLEDTPEDYGDEVVYCRPPSS